MIALAAGLFAVDAQTNQELLEAYRNGTLSQSQIENLKKSNESKAQNVRRTRQVNATATNKNEQTKVSEDLTSMPADPQGGLLEARQGQLETSANVSGVRQEASSSRRIYGHDLFTNKALTFEPNLNIATPDNYVLGPGDEVILDVWGDVQSSESHKISPDGRIVIPSVGPVTLSGLTIAEATKRLRGVLPGIYEGMYDGSVKMKLSLGSIRSIQVNVAGEVGTSGTYTLPSLATLFHALHVSGGVSNLGTLRSIKVYRSGKLFSEVDVYDYIINGKSDKDIALRDGDLISIPAYGKLVEISGEVKRPMFYEMAQSETVADLLRFAGDFTNEANRSVVSVTRRQGGKYNSYTVDSSDFDSFVLEDGDAVSVSGSINRYDNRVEIKGAVYREGFYAIDNKVKTVKQLIERADGLREDAFMARAVLYREKPDWTTEVVSIDLGGLMAGRVKDIELRTNDMLIIASVSEMKEAYTVTVFGSVSKPDTYPYADNMTVEDLLVAAGGLLESASTANVTITRRIKDPKSTKVQEQLFEAFTVSVKDGLTVDGEQGFVLEPFDEVFVRRSPVYITQSSVTVKGEVAFEGNYPLARRNMRLSEVVAAAGNATPGAYVEGAYLLRKMTDEEQMQQQALQNMIDTQAQMGGLDTLNMAGVELSNVYYVGINLKEALANPGSYADVVLRNGDVISIPEYNGTVRVMGAVLYPNTVTYKAKKNLKYYVESAGGFCDRARKNRAFVIHMNGMVESGMNTKVTPGAVVIIPSKSPSEPVKWSDVVAMLSSTASTAAVVLSAINLAR